MSADNLPLLTNDEENEENKNEISEVQQGLTVLQAALFIIGDISGSGLLALPKAVDYSGFIGLVLMTLAAFSSGYNGIRLGQCWTIVKRRYSHLNGYVQNPYAAMGEITFGSKMVFLVTLTGNATLFGASVVCVLLSSQNLQSLLDSWFNIKISFCYWMLVFGISLIPVCWLGSPKNFKAVGFIAAATTFFASILISCAFIANNFTEKPKPEFKSRTALDLILSIGIMMFSFGGTATFPTIQQDMKRPDKFHLSAWISYTTILVMYIVSSSLGYFTFGSKLHENVLQNISINWIKHTCEILITGHLLFSLVINVNPVFQTIEKFLNIPAEFGWKRCLSRTITMLVIIFVAESIPNFAALLSLVGAFSTFLTFIAPCLFYLKICSMEGEWTKESPIPLHHKVLSIELIIGGILIGICVTYSAVQAVVCSMTFVPPCYVNITAADFSVKS